MGRPKFKIESHILYEDNHLIAINKPFGILSQKDVTNDDSLIEHVKAYIKRIKDKPGEVFLGAVHRLDRPTTGVIIYCKTSKATSRMNELFKNRKIQKTYWAISSNTQHIDGKSLKNYLYKDVKKNQVRIVDKNYPGSKYAELSFKIIAILNNKTLIEVQPVTGRSHQIRIQMSGIGYPLIGDRKYGRKSDHQSNRLGLHCLSLSFIHPVKKTPIRISASLPEGELWKHFKTYIT